MTKFQLAPCQARQRPDDEGVEHAPQEATAAAAQGDVHIVPEEGAQAHVPAAPEFGDSPGDVGIVEIFQIMQAQHVTHADGHVGVSGEVQIDVQTVGDDAQPGACHRQLSQGLQIGCELGRIGQHTVSQDQGISQCAAGVGQQALFGKTGAEPGNTLGPLGLSGCAAEQIVVDGLVADDGTGDALVEQSGIQQHVPVALLGLGILPVYVDDISQQLEGVEGNADGQRDAADEVRHRAEYGHDQSGILEIADHTDFDNRCHGDPKSLLVAAFVFGNLQSAVPGNKCHEHQKQHILRFTPCIKNQGENQQHNVLSLLCLTQRVGQQG